MRLREYYIRGTDEKVEWIEDLLHPIHRVLPVSKQCIELRKGWNNFRAGSRIHPFIEIDKKVYHMVDEDE